MFIYIVDFRSETVQTKDECKYAIPEKTKRGPPTNKNISVRNMKAQITNMSLNENTGFKNEYHVMYISLDNFKLLIVDFKHNL